MLTEEQKAFNERSKARGASTMYIDVIRPISYKSNLQRMIEAELIDENGCFLPTKDEGLNTERERLSKT